MNQLIYERLKILPKDLREFCQKKQIIELALFGSILTDNFRPDSDIDLLVTFSDENMPNLLDFFQLEEEFKILLKRDVDLLEKSTVKTDPNWLRRQSILNKIEVIYESRSSLFT